MNSISQMNNFFYENTFTRVTFYLILHKITLTTIIIKLRRKKKRTQLKKRKMTKGEEHNNF